MIKLINNFHELKIRFIYIIISFLFTFLISWIYRDQLLYLLIKPLYNFFKNQILIELKLFILTYITEIVLIYCKISFICSIQLIIPFIILQLILFIILKLKIIHWEYKLIH